MNLACSGAGSDTPPGSSPGPETAAALDPLAPGAAIVCGVMQSEGRPAEPEIHVLYAMNQKLRHYPEFASAIGMDLVSSCESAERFVTAYGQYSLEHPGFDREQPLGDTPEDEPLTAEDDEGAAAGEVEKIFGGVGATNNPVVELTFPADPPNQHSSWGPRSSGSLCSGTFINKNWILTAAHCLTRMAVHRCKVSGQSLSACTPTWHTRSYIQIRGTKTDGHIPFALTNQMVRGYVHPTWLGRSLATNAAFCTQNCADIVLRGAETDLALLYIHSTEDHKLPPRVEEDGGMRLSIVEPSASWPLSYYGYGLPDAGLAILKSGDVASIANRMTFSVPPGGNTVVGSVPNALSPFPCGGDSGGPLVRSRLDLITNFGRKQQVQAVVAVMSAGTIDPCAPRFDIPQLEFYWTRIDRGPNREFIKREMKRWPIYRKLACTKRSLLPVAGSRVQVEECWGKPCAYHVDCAETELCSNSFDAYASTRSCTACDGTPEQGTCNCIVGQCVPRD